MQQSKTTFLAAVAAKIAGLQNLTHFLKNTCGGILYKIMGLFLDIIKANWFCHLSAILDVWPCSEYASALIMKFNRSAT